jgi:hypothetical protein
MISGDKTEGCIGVLDYWIIKFAPFNITGIGSFQDKKENAFMFPNPVSKWLYLTLQQKEAITIINTVGQNVYTETNTSTGKNILNVETLSPGIYFIKAGNTTLKFVKE